MKINSYSDHAFQLWEFLRFLYYDIEGVISKDEFIKLAHDEVDKLIIRFCDEHDIE